MKKFCDYLRENTIKTIKFKKKKMMSSTNEEYES